MEIPPALPGPAQPNAQLEELVFEYLELLEDGAPEPLESLCRAHPEHADGLRARVWLLRLMGTL